MRQMEKQLKNTGKTLQNIGKDMTRYVTAPIVAAGVAMTKMAMDAVESENLFAVSMGNMADSAREWSETLRKELGLNSFEVRKNVSTFNVMFGSMGIGTKGAYEMSKGLTQLAYDMASFYNLKPEEAFIKLQAGITGETEPLKRLGILVDEATTKTYAYKLGIAETGAELTQQQKLLGRYAAIMDQTSKAQGDLARTMDSPTNKLRRMTANIQQLAIEIGMKLIPMFEKLLGYVDKAVTWFGSLSSTQQDNIIKFGLFAAAAGPVVSVLGKMLSLTGGLIKSVGTLGANLTALGKAAPAMASASTGTMLGVFGAMAGLTAGAYALDKWRKDQIEQQTKDELAKNFNPLLGDVLLNAPKPSIEATRELEKTLGIETKIVDQTAELQSWIQETIDSVGEFGDVGTDALEDFSDSIRSVVDAIRSQTDAWANFSGMFDIFERKYISGDRLMKRMQAQVKAIAQWQDALVTIQGKGVSETFLNALRMQGPGSVDQIMALAKMSPDQLRQYEGMYNQKYGIAGTQAMWANQAQAAENNTINLYVTGNQISNEQDATRVANQIIGQLRLAGYGI
jgi:hypothetical protein